MDRRVETWSVYMEARQCACGDTDLARSDEPCDRCRVCGSDDEPASVCEVELLVPLDHHGEVAGDIVVQHGYTSGPGLLGGTYDIGRWLSGRAADEIVEEAQEKRALGRMAS